MFLSLLEFLIVSIRFLVVIDGRCRRCFLIVLLYLYCLLSPQLFLWTNVRSVKQLGEREARWSLEHLRRANGDGNEKNKKNITCTPIASFPLRYVYSLIGWFSKRRGRQLTIAHAIKWTLDDRARIINLLYMDIFYTRTLVNRRSSSLSKSTFWAIANEAAILTSLRFLT